MENMKWGDRVENFFPKDESLLRIYFVARLVITVKIPSSSAEPAGIRETGHSHTILDT